MFGDLGCLWGAVDELAQSLLYCGKEDPWNRLLVPAPFRLGGGGAGDTYPVTSVPTPPWSRHSACIGEQVNHNDCLLGGEPGNSVKSLTWSGVG